MATEAGSNTFQGSLFEFHRNEAFDSPNYFHPKGQQIPPLRQNQYGAAIGGPVLENRTFFFGSFEGTRMRRSLTRTFSVPTAAVRAGNFAGFASPIIRVVHAVCTAKPVLQLWSAARRVTSRARAGTHKA